ncbi:MAG: AraC family transcriptional regulator [Oscillospiraceae bacterium]|nr:AraC family transcriptional regulator [Oscillospiraceae bacterium]
MIVTTDINLTECGEQQDIGSVTMNGGDDHQFLLVMSGVRTILRINNRQYYMQPFTFLFHPFEDGGITIEAQDMTAYRYMRLQLSDRYIRRFRDLGMTVRETHTIAQPLAVEEIWKLILPAMQNANPLSELGGRALELLVCLLLEASDGSVTRAAEVPHYDKLTALRHKIYRHPEENWYIQDICDELGISRPYFHKIYLAAFGTTCTQDVIASRIACSKKLLETTDDAISTVSQLSGFETDVYFMRQFKRHVGMTPTAYRRIYRHSALQNPAEGHK